MRMDRKTLWLGTALVGFGLALIGTNAPKAAADSPETSSSITAGPAAPGSHSPRTPRAKPSGRPTGPGSLASRATAHRRIHDTGMHVDKNYESHVNEIGTVIRDRVIPDEGVNPAEYSDILKFSNSRDVIVETSIILGGQEDSIDAVRGANYTFRNLTVVPHRNGITAKGSIEGVLIENVMFAKHGSFADIEIGQFDDYWYVGRAPTRSVTIKNVNAEDGKPVIVILWDAAAPTVLDSNVTIIAVPKIIWFPYFVIRAIQTRGLRGLCPP